MQHSPKLRCRRHRSKHRMKRRSSRRKRVSSRKVPRPVICAFSTSGTSGLYVPSRKDTLSSISDASAESKEPITSVEARNDKNALLSIMFPDFEPRKRSPIQLRKWLPWGYHLFPFNHRFVAKAHLEMKCAV